MIRGLIIPAVLLAISCHILAVEPPRLPRDNLLLFRGDDGQFTRCQDGRGLEEAPRRDHSWDGSNNGQTTGKGKTLPARCQD